MEKKPVVVLYKSNPINEKETIEIAKKVKELKSKGYKNKDIILITLNDFSFKLNNTTLDFSSISKIVNCLVKLYHSYRKDPSKLKSKLKTFNIVNYCKITNEEYIQFKTLLNQPQFKSLIANLIKSILDLKTHDSLHIPTSLSPSELLPYFKNLSLPDLFEAHSIISSSKSIINDISTNFGRIKKLAKKVVKGGACPGRYRPLIEIYKFKIPDWDYRVPPSERHSFNEIESVPIATGIERLRSGIGIDPADNKIYTVDILNSTKKTGGEYDITKLYDNFLKFPAFSQIDDFKTNKLSPASVDVFRRYLTEAIEFNKQYFGLTKPDGSYLDGIEEETGYVYKYKVPENTKVIIVGDLHGSYHTFFRTLIRLHAYNVIDLSTFSVNDGYLLVFLGDIVDRGAFGVEMLYILCGFLSFQLDRYRVEGASFKPRIFLNRGNHEAMNYQFNPADPYRVLIEMLTKGACASSYDSLGRLVLGECSILGDFFRSCPSAIILVGPEIKDDAEEAYYERLLEKNLKVWCCHGGIPRSSDTRERIKHLEAGKIAILNARDAYDVRWSDVFSSRTLSRKFSRPSKALFCDSESVRGGGCSYLPFAIDEALVEMELDFIIRGHQDFPGNNVILYDWDKEDKRFLPTPRNPHGDLRVFDPEKQILPHGLNLDFNNNILIPKDNPYSIYQNDDPIAGNFYDGPIIKMDLLYIDEPFNSVLTTSTNSDNGRYLNSDNFVVLDLFNCSNPSDFSISTLEWPEDEKINETVYEILEEFKTKLDPTTGGKRGGASTLKPLNLPYPEMEKAVPLVPIRYVMSYLDYLKLNLPLPEE